MFSSPFLFERSTSAHHSVISQFVFLFFFKTPFAVFKLCESVIYFLPSKYLYSASPSPHSHSDPLP